MTAFSQLNPHCYGQGRDIIGAVFILFYFYCIVETKRWIYLLLHSYFGRYYINIFLMSLFMLECDIYAFSIHNLTAFIKLHAFSVLIFCYEIFLGFCSGQWNSVIWLQYCHLWWVSNLYCTQFLYCNISRMALTKSNIKQVIFLFTNIYILSKRCLSPLLGECWFKSLRCHSHPWHWVLDSIIRSSF